MNAQRTLLGYEIRLKPRGVGRFLTVIFLSFWLCGWAIGEGFALWILIKGGYALLTGTPPDPGRAPLQVAPALAVGAFLLLWLTLWTFGGIAAFWALLSAVWAEDRIIARADGILLETARGPFRFRREFPRDRLRRIVLGHRNALVLDTDRVRVPLSDLGTSEEREEAAESLRKELGLSASVAEGTELPQGWQEIITPEGERAVTQDTTVRKKQARVATGVTVGLFAVTFVIVRKSLVQPGLLPLAVIFIAASIGLATGSAWLVFGRIEYRLGAASITVRRRFRSGVRDLFEARRLEITTRTDSDSDDWYSLEGLSSEAAAKGRRKIVSVLHDPTVPRMLGAWLSRTAGIPLEDKASRAARMAEVAGLIAQLGQSGRFGRGAATMIRRSQGKQP